ncbi:MAG: DegT/DnrJ/EryC1/StrS family aminotransferase [Slackia sp.]
MIQDGYQPGLIQKKWRSACNSVRSFLSPDISDTEIEEVVEALRSGWITTGPRTKRLEQELTEFTQVRKPLV